MALGVGDIVRTTANFQLGNGVQYQNVFHHIFDGIGGISDAAVVADIKSWHDTMYAELVTVTRNDVIVQLSFVDQVEWVTDEWKVVENIGTFTGVFNPSATSDALPNQMSAFVVFKTARPKSVGRKFLFPGVEGFQDEGTMAAAYVTAVVQWADDAVNDINLDVANDLHPGIVRTGVNDFLVFDAAVVTNLMGTQRRRRPGYGA